MPEIELNTDPNRGYLGNVFIKRDGITQKFTAEEIVEYQKCMADPGYFAETYVKVINLNKGLVPFKLYPYQRTMFKHFTENRFSIVLACRQSGKCQHINTFLNVKHKHTGNRYKINMGDFHDILASKGLPKDYRGIDPSGSSEASYLEGKDQSNSPSSRSNFSTVFEKAGSPEGRPSRGGGGNVSAVHRRSDVPSMQCVSEIRYTPTCSSRTRADDYRVSSPNALSIHQISILQEDVRREESLEQPRREDESILNKVRSQSIPDRGFYFQGSPESGLQHQGIILDEKVRRRLGDGEGTTHGKAVNLFFGLMYQEARGRDWTEHFQRQANSLAEDTREKIGERKGADSSTERYRQNVRAIQSQTGGEGYSGNSLCCEIDGSNYQEDILESWDHVEEFREEAVEARNHSTRNAHGGGLPIQVNVLSSVQNRAENSTRECDIQVPIKASSNLDYGSPNSSAELLLSDSIERKFVEEFSTDDWEVLSDSGWVPIISSKKTIAYDEWEVTLDDGRILTVADTHIFFTNELEEVFAKDCEGMILFTSSGPQTVLSVSKNGRQSQMYDLEVDSNEHRYFGDGVLSHNSISSVIYLLWYAIFHPEKTIVILANKGSTAREMLSRVTLALENLPFFLQPGCKSANKGNIKFSNNSNIIAAGTSSNSIRGLSVNLLFLDEFAFVHNAAEFYTSTYPVISSGESTQVIITSTANGVGNLFYRLWEGAIQQANLYKHMRVDWWDVPGRDEKWKADTIANTSPLQFDQEFGNCLSILSQVAIRINKMYECLIRIGDLYLAGRRANTSGLSLEEEIRLLALRWNHIEEEIRLPNGGTPEVIEVPE